MSDLILHHYDLSPFGEKIRLALGYKKLAWHSVEIPIWPPRPDTTPLTAGYRRVPVLQVGADIYCDTQLILREIERRHPTPTLYPNGAGIATALGWWADTTLFMPAATLTTSIIGDGIPPEFIQDRIAFMKHDFSKGASARELPVNRQRVVAQMALLADMLRDGRPFLVGQTLSAADLAAYHVLWFVKKNGGPDAEKQLPFAPLSAWMDRMATIGHGTRHAMTPADAIAIAKKSQPDTTRFGASNDPSGIVAGTAVMVRADDANDPISGTYVWGDETEIVIRHDHPRIGTVHVHFPRFGYSVVPANSPAALSTPEYNKQLARDYFKAFLAADQAWWTAHIAPTFRRHDPGLPFEVVGPQGVKQLADALLPGIPDMRLPIEAVIAEGEMVLVRLRVQGTHGGELMGMPATGKKIDIGVLDLFQFRDGKLIEHWALLDNLGMLKQLGVTSI
jgi:glutathione S-transferase